MSKTIGDVIKFRGYPYDFIITHDNGEHQILIADSKDITHCRVMKAVTTHKLVTEIFDETKIDAAIVLYTNDN